MAPIPLPYRYICLSVLPPTTEVLTLRKSFQDALTQAFGTTSSSTYLDILWVAEDGLELIIRVGNADAEKIMSAVVPFTSGNLRLSLKKESSFLSSLL